jgi:ribosome-associated protein
LTGGRALTRKTPVKKKTKAAAPKPAKKSVKKPSRKAASAPKAAPAKAKAAKPKAKPAKKPAPKKAAAPAPAKAAPISDLMRRIVASLEDDKAEEIVTVDLAGRSSLCDAAVIASGRSTRHVMSIAEHLARRLKEEGYGTRPVTGAAQGDWALVDAGDVIVHVFRPEVREYYDLEGMWAVGAAADAKRPKARQK